ncbi:MAG: hypothetical protein BGO78_06695 [Chloroflexi bacterium 44-23]|nr:MAG: hypothetical protein BGO78_06695 [Chloroflexi bacterium 44-23]
MKSLSELNKQQYKAVTAESGATLVLAGPGSGKTRVLTHRIAYLVQEVGIPPYNILAVTFTNKAAREMKNRLEKMLGRKADGLWLGTFHSVCARILRREAQYLPVDNKFVIFDVDDQLTLLKNIIRGMNLDEKIFKPSAIQATISKAKNDIILPETYIIRSGRDSTIRDIYGSYEKALRLNNAVDFDDLLLMTVHLLSNYPEVRERYANRFEYVLVDEFQDTNQIQYKLVKLFASVHKCIFVVGDEDQSIYRWRGADYKNVLRFEQDYHSASKILLEENYRSTQIVLDVAKAVIDRNLHRTPKQLFTQRSSDELVHFYVAGDDREEAQYVINTILEQQRRGVQAGSFAIMYRINAQSRLLEEAFLKAGLPYRLVGAQRFYGRREVKDIIAFLRLVHNPKDEVSLQRVINVPPRKIGDKTIDKLSEVARWRGESMGETLLALAANSENSELWLALERSAKSLTGFAHLLAGWVSAAESASLPDLFDRIVLDLEYQQYLNEGSEEEVIDRWANVQELRRIAFEYDDQGIAAFLESLALVSDQDTVPEKTEAPTLLTLHAAKGLEFDQVFIIGLDDGVLPHSRAFDDDEELAEERRLFYVGITRARNVLYLVHTERRNAYGTYENQLPSRFLQDIPIRLLSEDSSFNTFGRLNQYPRSSRRWSHEREDYSDLSPRASSGSGGQARTRVYTWENAQASSSRGRNSGSASILPQGSDAPKRDLKSEAVYKAGMKVRHKSFGEGVILTVHLEGDGEETLEIFFVDIKEMKKLAASFAKLEVISE